MSLLNAPRKKTGLPLPLLLLGLGVLAPVAAQATDVSLSTTGIRVKSDDGSIEALIGGRIQFDAVYMSPDTSAFNSTPAAQYGSANSAVNNSSGTYFRRVYLTLGGHVYDWDYLVEDDLDQNPADAGAGKEAAQGLNQLWIGHKLLKDGMLYIGQRKTWRGMEDIRSNNETLFMETPLTEATSPGGGIFGGRSYQEGLFYKWAAHRIFAGGAVYTLARTSNSTTQGFGVNGRLAGEFWKGEKSFGYAGATFSLDSADNNSKLSAGSTYTGIFLDSAVTANVASFGGSGSSAKQESWTAELGAGYHAAQIFGEYAHANIGADGVKGANLFAYVVEGSYTLTGETRTYNDGLAIINGWIKPTHRFGAVELKARYELLKNEDVNAAGNVGACSISTGTLTKTTVSPKKGIDNCSVGDFAVGLNWYVNSAVRFQLDYVMGDANLGTLGHDRPDTVAGRIGLIF